MVFSRVGTVGYTYRDWVGIFYPPQSSLQKQFAFFSQHFNVCELTQFTTQMPEKERIERLNAQTKTDMRFFVRLHNAFTHFADSGLTLSLAKHFYKALQPLYDAGKLGGLVAAFPYAFKDSPGARDYVEELSRAFVYRDLSFHVDFRHPSWANPNALEWMASQRLACVCVDEPAMPGLVPPIAVATADHVLVRFHGRNAQSWWSGNSTTRYDYNYSEAELQEMHHRYEALIGRAKEVSFVFQNHWQAQSVRNAFEWKKILAMKQRSLQIAVSPEEPLDELDEESFRPPVSLSVDEVKSRVNQAFSSSQYSFDLPQKAEESEI